jgi:hypothetical protein
MLGRGISGDEGCCVAASIAGHDMADTDQTPPRRRRNSCLHADDKAQPRRHGGAAGFLLLIQSGDRPER